MNGTENLSAPIVVNGVVYVLSSTGELRKLAEGDGTLLWSTDTGGPIPVVEKNSGEYPRTGLSAAGGALVVPAGTRLIAYW